MRRCRALFVRERIHLLILDELGNFIDSESGRILLAAASWLKTFMMQIAVPVVALGAGETVYRARNGRLYSTNATAVLGCSTQLSGRFQLRHTLGLFDPPGEHWKRRQRRHSPIDEEIWDDRAEQDARHLVALLFVAASPLRRAEVGGTLRVGPARLSRACAVLRADPPRGLRLEESGDRLGLVSAPDCASVVERHLGQPVREPLSQAALEALSIVVYEQPVTRADIRAIRGVDQ
jgi:hypothetical protein